MTPTLGEMRSSVAYYRTAELVRNESVRTSPSRPAGVLQSHNSFLVSLDTLVELHAAWDSLCRSHSLVVISQWFRFNLATRRPQSRYSGGMRQGVAESL